MLFLAVLFSVLFLATGCTERGKPPVHPEGWKDATSPNFHAVKIASSGIGLCKSCHGESYLGGTSDVSCGSCHAGGPSGHPEFWSFITPDSVAYHGRIFWENGWDFAACQQCHGEDFDKPRSSGGVVELSCSRCHSQGIESCTTCHGDRDSGHTYPPKDIMNRSDVTLVSVGAHEAHLESDIATVACEQCHVVPQNYKDQGHLGPDNIAEVTFGTIATDSGQAEPVWERSEATCSEAYCHGSFTYGGVSGNHSTPTWTSPGSVVCGTCHGIPPTGHFGSYSLEQCSDCHSSVVDSNGQIVDRTKHVNGERDF